MLGLEKVAEAGWEVITDAEKIAPLGSVKTPEYAALVKAMVGESLLIKDVKSSELSASGFRSMYFITGPDFANNRFLEMRPQEIAKNAAEALCDYHITPEQWNMASMDEKTKMITDAVYIIGQEMRLPNEWINSMEPSFMDIQPQNGSLTLAYAECRFYSFPDGSVHVAAGPELVINTKGLDRSYYEVMSTLYHEMVHIKQYASIDGLTPTPGTDFRLLDLIDHVRERSVGNSSRVSYLASPAEAEAWAQGLYFEEMLKAVVKEYGFMYA